MVLTRVIIEEVKIKITAKKQNRQIWGANVAANAEWRNIFSKRVQRYRGYFKFFQASANKLEVEFQ